MVDVLQRSRLFPENPHTVEDPFCLKTKQQHHSTMKNLNLPNEQEFSKHTHTSIPHPLSYCNISYTKQCVLNSHQREIKY